MAQKAIDSTHAGTDAIIGAPVFRLNGEKIGKIDELIIDLESGRVAYAVVSFGSMLGWGEKVLALPWPLISFDPDHQGVVLDLTEEQLRRAPTFDSERRTRVADRNQGEIIHRYYGIDPNWR